MFSFWWVSTQERNCLFYNIWRTTSLFSKFLYFFPYSHNTYSIYIMVLIFLHPQLIFFFLYHWLSTVCEVISHWRFDLHFPMVNHFEHLFIAYWIFVYLLSINTYSYPLYILLRYLSFHYWVMCSLYFLSKLPYQIHEL